MRGTLILFRKEMLDVLRDRRMLFMTVLLPVLLYPALMLAIGELMLAGRAKLDDWVRKSPWGMKTPELSRASGTA